MATKPKKFIINVSLGNDNEPKDIFVGANGDDFLLTRGKDVEVPEGVLEALNNAVTGVSEVDPSDHSKTITVERKRFPYSVVGVAA